MIREMLSFLEAHSSLMDPIREEQFMDEKLGLI